LQQKGFRQFWLGGGLVTEEDCVAIVTHAACQKATIYPTAQLLASIRRLWVASKQLTVKDAESKSAKANSEARKKISAIGITDLFNKAANLRTDNCS